MTTPITYYGGKQRLVKYLLPLIPEHNHYIEAFAGGAALLFAKAPSKAETLNDTNGLVVNFFRMAREQFDRLKVKVDGTPHSRNIHSEAFSIYNNPEGYDPVTRAWALWVLTSQGFSAKIGSWGFGRNEKVAKTLANKRKKFTMDIAHRLEHVQFECNDALKIIKQYDAPDAFFYIDPPYFNSDCGHYKGYTQADFINLLEILSHIKGKFLLSNYPSDILTKFIKKHNWNFKQKEQHVNVTSKTKKKKIEMMVFNYDEPNTGAIIPIQENKLTSKACKQLLEKNGEQYKMREVKKIQALLMQVYELEQKSMNK